ncbi:probable purine permease 10 [Morus notabilis]|uniref:probable purine permease 10 n=1 Tax=Morus notabilis TaxID=981085 RepID=UPI000CED2DCA|nr:probable purine permease 10 [Morus notabilis]
MEESEQLKLKIMAQEANEVNSSSLTSVSNQSSTNRLGNYLQWLRVAIYAFLLLCGQSTAMLLGRLYYDKGGKSQWMGTLVQLAGFPILSPYYCIARRKNTTITNSFITGQKSVLILALVCVFLGIVLAADCFLYSVGLMYLPVSTYSLICASQLAFNAFFSFFLNSQKFTPYTVNSLVLLTISSMLIVFQADSEDNPEAPKGKYAIGFICTVAASAVYGLMLCLTQFAIEKILKRETFSVIMDITVCESLIATCAVLVGLFVSGEWKGLNEEMHAFSLGKASYVMTLAGTAISWQAFFIGTVGLILEVSSLFSNAISVLGLPVVPVLAVFFFHEKMDGVKVMALLLAIWGFISYVYQNYLNIYSSPAHNRNGNEETGASPGEDIHG